MQKSILQRPKFDIVACHLLGFLVAMGLISMDAFTMKSGSGSSLLVTSVSSTPDFRNVFDPFGRGPYGLYGRTEIPQRSSLLPYLGVLSFRSEAPGGIGTATPRVHHAHRLGNSMAARGAMSASPHRSNTKDVIDAVLHYEDR